MRRTVVAGFIPLVDAAVLVAARECGFARDRGIELSLVRQPSWALLRDHLNLRHLDCAHALAPLPIASRLGLGQIESSLCAPFVLSRGGNAISVTRALAGAMRSAAEGSIAGPERSARALARVISSRQRPVTFGMVYPFSGHNFELRYWLALANIDPDNDVRIVSVPPPMMVESMEAGYIDGFCVGEPWNSVAVCEGVGEIVVTKSEIFPAGIEKVLAMHESSLSDSAASVDLLGSLLAAAEWCDSPQNKVKLAEILSQPEYLDIDPTLILNALTGRLPTEREGDDADFLYFYRRDANRPSENEALWLYAQMRRWRLVAGNGGQEESVRSVFRAELYDQLMDDTASAESPPDNRIVNRPNVVRSCDSINYDGEPIDEYLGRFA